MNKIIASVQKDLIKNIDPKTLNSFQRFFKPDEKINYHGVKSADVGKIAKKYWQEIKNLPKKEIFNLCEELLKTNYTEEAWIAYEFAYLINKQYTQEDFKIFEHWVKTYVSNWAECDTLCNHAMGAIVEKYPELVEKLKEWTKLPNRWAKRASAVSLILPARKGQFLKEAFEIADFLLKDPDDLVQKGYGWLLKEESRKHPKEVFEYLMKYKTVMPRTAFRYALEKMPENLKKKAMEK
ncbi:MAG: DNA alkylation repair protein [Patescibacteria group bacterium]|nr:DNA alkylation repair protein [Patescibacteria group bacterium]